ncbi:DUF6089 family protein [Prevotella sp. HUN102]|uniref:type IX secretion system protein PorG n=1 Tax=Prevotella sp. HUN102 TaxID=1392486 RepID=UPI000490CF54|nr:DUF6089 family protein [Prevotella sp. HUN102]
MKRLLFYILLLLAAAPLKAQDGEEYRMEMGAGVGMLGYLGDFNGSLTKNLQPMGSLVARYVFNPYMGLKMNVSYGKVKGSSADVETYYPKFAQKPYEFNNTLVDVGLTYEYNFWPYGTGREYRGAQKFTPFVFGGLGATYVKLEDGDRKSAFSANVPIGIGVKYKIGERTNIGLEWAMHFSLTDEIDGQKDPYDIKSSGAFKNTDCYSTLQLTFTYSFMAKCRTCHNEDE